MRIATRKRKPAYALPPALETLPPLEKSLTIEHPSSFVAMPELETWLAQHGMLERRHYERRRGERRHRKEG